MKLKRELRTELKMHEDYMNIKLTLWQKLRLYSYARKLINEKPIMKMCPNCLRVYTEEQCICCKKQNET